MNVNYNMNVGTSENPNIVPVSITYSEENLIIVEKEAYNGEYTIAEENDN